MPSFGAGICVPQVRVLHGIRVTAAQNWGALQADGRAKDAGRSHA